MDLSRRLPPPFVGGGGWSRAFCRAALLCSVALSVAGASVGCGIVPATLEPDESQPNEVTVLLRTADGSASATAPIQPSSVLNVLYDTTSSQLALGGLSLRIAPVSLDVAGGVQVDVAATTASLDLSSGVPVANVDPAGDFQLQVGVVAITEVSVDGVTIPFVRATGGPVQGHVEYNPSDGSVAVALEGTEFFRFILAWGPDVLIVTGDLAASFVGPVG